jgi:hypothetical protein
MEYTSGTNLKDAVLRAIEVYNMYRSPEATAKLVTIKKDGFVIDFGGSFCNSCGVRDYFEDFIYELETINKQFKVELVETKPTGSQSFRVQYRIRDSFPKADEEDSLFRKFLLDRGLSFKDFIVSNPCTKDVTMFQFRTWLFERKQRSKKSSMNFGTARRE